MNKRIAVIFLIILVSGMITLGYFISQSRKDLLTDPFKAIAPDASLVIETADIIGFISSVTDGKGIFSVVEQVEEFRLFNSKLKYFADQLNKPGYKRFMDPGKAIISFHSIRDGRVESFLSMSVRSEMRLRHLREAMRAAGIMDTEELRINGKTMIVAPFKTEGGSDTLYLTVNSGLLLCSTSEALVNRALTMAPGDKDVRSVPGFSKVLLSAGKDEDKVFVVFSNLARTIRPLLVRDAAGIADKISKLAGSAVGDLYINGKGIALSGYTESSDSSESLYRYRNIEPGIFHTYKVLPSATLLFESLIMKPGYLGSKRTAGVSAETHRLALSITPFIGKEITRAYIDIRGGRVSDNMLVIYELTNRVQCEQLFVSGLDRNSGISYFEPDDQTRIPIYKTDNRGLISILMPGFAPGFNDSYYA